MSVTSQNHVVHAGWASLSHAPLRWLRRLGSCRRNGLLATIATTWPTALVVVLALVVSAAVDAASEPPDRETVPSKVWRYAQRWVARHDRDGDGRLSEAEWQPVEGSLHAADLDQDTIVTVEELTRHMADFGMHRKIRLMPANGGGVVPLPSLLAPAVAGGAQPAAFQAGEAAALAADEQLAEPGWGDDETADDAEQRKYFIPPSRLPPGLPDWFQKADHDGDGQLTFAEYIRLGSSSADKEFAKYDLNRDGLITPSEVLGGSNRVRKRTQPEPIAPETTPEENAATEEKTAAEDEGSTGEGAAGEGAAAEPGTAAEEEPAAEEKPAAEAASEASTPTERRPSSGDSSRDPYSRRRQRPK
jgi:hypothetical protein